MMKIVVLDAYTANPGDLSWEKLKEFGEFIAYDRTPPEKIVERAKDADIVVLNAAEMTAEILNQLPKLKLITLLATGFNNIDLTAAKSQGIAVCNTPSYSTEAVSQHTIALLLEITNHVALHSAAIHKGAWHKSPDECFSLKPLSLLDGKTIGIVGYGSIGKRVGKIAEALGMKVLPYSSDPETAIKADVLSLHCPLTQENREMINAEFIARMKDGAILLNTARGGLIDESALLSALQSGKIAAAGIDVISTEPPRGSEKNPLIGAPNCFITPHHAWTPLETRQLLLDVAYENIKSFLSGNILNRINF
jgi:glycerate dehydrogenase